MEEKVKQLHPNLKKFVNRSLDLIHLNQFYDQFRKEGGIMDGYHMHVHIVQWFLNLEFEQPSLYQSVKQLPEIDIKDCLFYLNYLLGTTTMTGGHDYIKIYDKIQTSMEK
jgi:hypothetical protein